MSDTTPTLTDEQREEVALMTLHALRDAWRDEYSAKTVADKTADALMPLIARMVADAEARALREALSGIKTHNGTSVAPKNLRWAATHEALCRSYIFDVLNGLADALDRADRIGGTP